VSAIRTLVEKWPAHGVLVEDKANGPAVISMLRHEISGLIAVNPEGGKVSRAHAVSAVVEAGNVFLPHPRVAPWVDGYLAELSIFPNGRHDDQVDQTTQALNRLSGGPTYGLIAYMEEQQTNLEAERQDRLQETARRLRELVVGGPLGDQVRLAPEAPEGAPFPAAGCPECGSHLIQRVGGGNRCGACGWQFDTFTPIDPATIKGNTRSNRL
jgi:predicted phage terminase large subunit-like protein